MQSMETRSILFMETPVRPMIGFSFAQKRGHPSSSFCKNVVALLIMNDAA